MAARNQRTRKDSQKGDKKEPGRIGRTFKRLIRFFSELRAELKRVVWPDKKKLIHSTLIVLAICIAAGIFLWLVDSALMGILNGVGFYNNSRETTAAVTAPTTVASTVATTVQTTSDS